MVAMIIKFLNNSLKYLESLQSILITSLFWRLFPSEYHKEINAKKNNAADSNDIMYNSQRHKWFIPAPSMWPFFTAFSIFLILFGFVLVLHSSWKTTMEMWFIYLGLMGFVFSLIKWFCAMIKEGTYKGAYTEKVQSNFSLASMLFIVSEMMFFLSFFWAYFHNALSPSMFDGCTWPTQGVVSFIINEDWTNEKIFNKIFFDNFVFGEVVSVTNYKGFPEEKLFDLYASIVGKAPLLEMFNDYQTLKILSAYVAHQTPDVTLLKSLMELDFGSQMGPDEGHVVRNLYSLFIAEDKFRDNLKDSFNSFTLDLSELSNNTVFDDIAVDLIKNYSVVPSNIIHLNIFDKGVLVNPYKLPLLNTVVLLISGATLTLSHKFLKLKKYGFSFLSLLVTIFLALGSIGCQMYEYCHANLSLNDGIFGSVFYMLTGFHGFHVIMGTIFLTVCLVSLFVGHFNNTDHLSFECAIWYRHFVDVVRMLSYISVYLWPSIYFFGDSIFTWHISPTSVTINMDSSVVKFLLFLSDVKMNFNWYNVHELKRDNLDFFFFMNTCTEFMNFFSTFNSVDVFPDSSVFFFCFFVISVSMVICVLCVAEVFYYSGEMEENFDDTFDEETHEDRSFGIFPMEYLQVWTFYGLFMFTGFLMEKINKLMSYLKQKWT